MQILDLCSTQIECCVPADGLPTGFGLQLWPGNPLGALDPSDMILKLGAGKPGGERIVWIALDLHPSIRCATYDDRTGVGAIHGTGSDCFFFFCIH
jgi:hypothetical protein